MNPAIDVSAGIASSMTAWAQTALLIVDLQNDFLHPDGAYGRNGTSSENIAALPARVAPVAAAMRATGGMVVSTHFTLVSGRNGKPIISPHLLKLRPFLKQGDFQVGSWGHDIVNELKPVDAKIEKVAYSAFYQTRLEWLLRKLGISRLLVCGIVTNGGVASTVRDAHVRDIDVLVLEDGCAAFDRQTHRTAIESLQTVARIVAIEQVMAELKSA
jgi:ureidoacrylate peracid hydrolase